jgi:ABC-2 type transport system permease protein
MTAIVLAPSHRTRVPSAAPQVATLFARAVVDRWRSLLVWTLGLVGIGAAQLSVYPSVQESGESMQAFVDQWPEAFREAFGLEAYGTGPGYLNAELFSMLVPLVLVAVAVGAAAAATAGEEERGTADLLLSLPVSRTRVLVAKTFVMVASVAVVALAGWVALVVGTPLVDLDVPAADLAAAFVMTGLLGLLFGAVALLVGALTGSRPAALGAGIGLAIAAFLLNVLAPMASWLEGWKDASPFAWALQDDPLTTGLDGPGALALLGVTVLLVLLAWVAFRRRDVATR